MTEISHAARFDRYPITRKHMPATEIMMSNNAMSQALDLSERMKADRRWRSQLHAAYWGLTFFATRIIERFGRQAVDKMPRVLNFGCGLSFFEDAVNADVFVPQRFLRNRRRPDFYWTGLTEMHRLKGYFTGIVCEHVIEHMLPGDAKVLFGNFYKTLATGGTLVVSFPDVRRCLGGISDQGYSQATVATNAMVYLYGHKFMYDSEIVSELLGSQGFSAVETVEFDSAPLHPFLNPSRECESLYLAARKITS